VIAAVAFCPNPPVLIPEIAQGAAAELDQLRAACRTAITRIATRAPHIVVIGAGERRQCHAPTARGSLAPYGLDLEMPLGSDDSGPVELPLSLTIGGWLLRDALGPNNGADGWSVTVDDEPGFLEATAARSCSLLVMADGSAQRNDTAPGYLDDRAAEFDSQISTALRTGQADLLNQDFALAAELQVAGAAAWDAAAFELQAHDWDAELLYDAAPYGVGYFAAVWTRR
jgi:hypothetical protein